MRLQRIASARGVAAFGMLSWSLAGAPAPAQNQLANPDFDGSLTGWFPVPGEMTYSELDAGEEPGSGSALSDVVGFAWQYVGVTGGVSYDFGARLRATNVGQGGTSRVIVDWFELGAGLGCGDAASHLSSASTESLGSATGPFDRWLPFYATATAPPTAICAQVTLAAEQAVTRFDGVVFAVAGALSLPLFVNGFESGSTSGWSFTEPD